MAVDLAMPAPGASHDRVKLARRLTVTALLLAAATAGIVHLTRPAPLAVVVHTVGRGPVEATVANTRAGTINARRRAKLAPGQGGQVAALHVREGDRVAAGQVLIELWNQDLRAQRELAHSEVERANAMAEEARLRAELAEGVAITIGLLAGTAPAMRAARLDPIEALRAE
jgi:HlyD family secretion protein